MVMTLLLSGHGRELSVEQLTDESGELLALPRRELVPHRERRQSTSATGGVADGAGGTEVAVRMGILSQEYEFPSSGPTPRGPQRK